MLRRYVVPKGTIRRTMQRMHGLRDSGSGTIDPDTRTQAQLELAATLPTFTVDEGRRELASYYDRARRG